MWPSILLEQEAGHYTLSQLKIKAFCLALKLWIMFATSKLERKSCKDLTGVVGKQTCLQLKSRKMEERCPKDTEWYMRNLKYYIIMFQLSTLSFSRLVWDRAASEIERDRKDVCQHRVQVLQLQCPPAVRHPFLFFLIYQNLKALAIILDLYYKGFSAQEKSVCADLYLYLFRNKPHWVLWGLLLGRWV